MTTAAELVRRVREAYASDEGQRTGTTYTAPHAAAGSPQGGQFTATNNGGGKKPPPKAAKPAPRPAGKPAPAAKAAPPPPSSLQQAVSAQYANFGTLSERTPAGDQRTKNVQTLMRSLGMQVPTDGHYDKAMTAQVKDIQNRLGMNPTGRITSSLMKTLQRAAVLSPCAKESVVFSAADLVRRVREGFNPDQRRAPGGTGIGGRWVSMGAVLTALRGSGHHDAAKALRAHPPSGPHRTSTRWSPSERELKGHSRASADAAQLRDRIATLDEDLKAPQHDGGRMSHPAERRKAELTRAELQRQLAELEPRVAAGDERRRQHPDMYGDAQPHPSPAGVGHQDSRPPGGTGPVPVVPGAAPKAPRKAAAKVAAAKAAPKKLTRAALAKDLEREAKHPLTVSALRRTRGNPAALRDSAETDESQARAIEDGRVNGYSDLGLDAAGYRRMAAEKRSFADRIEREAAAPKDQPSIPEAPRLTQHERAARRVAAGYSEQPTEEDARVAVGRLTRSQAIALAERFNATAPHGRSVNSMTTEDLKNRLLVDEVVGHARRTTGSPDSAYVEIVDGSLDIKPAALRVAPAKSAAAKVAAAKASAEPPHAIAARLHASTDENEARAMLSGLTVKQLNEVAAAAGLERQSGRKAEIVDRIAYQTVGHRVDSAVLRTRGGSTSAAPLVGPRPLPDVPGNPVPLSAVDGQFRPVPLPSKEERDRTILGDKEYERRQAAAKKSAPAKAATPPAKSAAAKVKAAKASADPPEVTRDKLNAATSREEGRQILAGLTLAQLKAVSPSSAGVSKNKSELIHNIVTQHVGARMQHSALTSLQGRADVAPDARAVDLGGARVGDLGGSALPQGFGGASVPGTPTAPPAPGKAAARVKAAKETPEELRARLAAASSVAASIRRMSKESDILDALMGVRATDIRAVVDELNIKFPPQARTAAARKLYIAQTLAVDNRRLHGGI